MARPFENMTFLFTGKLKTMKRDDAEAKVTALGGKVASSVTKNLSVLVATSETSAKTKAQELNSKGANIQLWTEEQFMAELEKAEASATRSTNDGAGKTEKASTKKAPKAAQSTSKPKLSAKKLMELNKALFEAITHNNAKEVRSLINEGADVNAKDNRCRTPLHCWILQCENDADGVKLLIKAGADVNTKDNNGNTPLHINYISANAAKALIGAGADVNATNNDGRTPLHWCQYASTAKVLIKAGADVSAKDNDGSTPLHYCEHSDVAKLLIDAGADVNAENNEGETPLDAGINSSLWEDDDMEKLLVNAGAVRHKDQEDEDDEEDDEDDENDEDDEEDRILKLVKKHLAEAAPNSMTAAEIRDKLKEEGLPATQSSATHFSELLGKWVSEGILVRVERGVYKLADN